MDRHDTQNTKEASPPAGSRTMNDTTSLPDTSVPEAAFPETGAHENNAANGATNGAPDQRSKPPRARVSDAPLPDDDADEAAGDKLSRKKDYLAGFLAQKPATTAAGEPGGELYEAVVDALKSIYDPEIPVNIYDLGLIYAVEVSEDADVAVTMTLTTPNCPVAESMPAEAELRVSSVPGVRDAQVVVTWDPPWDPSKMSDEARLELGML